MKLERAGAVGPGRKGLWAVREHKRQYPQELLRSVFMREFLPSIS